MNYLSASEIAGSLAKKTGLTTDQVRKFLQAQAEMAYERSREGFQIPGLGVLVAIDRPSRELIMNFGPDAGKRVTQPAGTSLRFHIAEVVKSAVTGDQPAPADVFNLELFKDGKLDVV